MTVSPLCPLCAELQSWTQPWWEYSAPAPGPSFISCVQCPSYLVTRGSDNTIPETWKILVEIETENWRHHALHAVSITPLYNSLFERRVFNRIQMGCWWIIPICMEVWMATFRKHWQKIFFWHPFIAASHWMQRREKKLPLASAWLDPGLMAGNGKYNCSSTRNSVHCHGREMSTKFGYIALVPGWSF